MRRQQEDLFESGKAYRNSFFGSGSPPQSGPPQGSGFPGFGPGPDVGGGGFGGYHDGGGNLPVPFGGQPAQQSPGGLGSLLGNLPIKDIKAFVDRMGGIEGIVNTITKMNALMKNVQQMAPMIKLLAASFLKKGDSGGDAGNVRRKRRRKRKRTSNYYRSGKSKSRSNYGKKPQRRR